jgi:hypothetical protein
MVKTTWCDDCGRADVPLGLVLVEDRWGVWWADLCQTCQVVYFGDPEIWSMMGIAAAAEKYAPVPDLPRRAKGRRGRGRPEAAPAGGAGGARRIGGTLSEGGQGAA